MPAGDPFRLRVFINFLPALSEGTGSGLGSGSGSEPDLASGSAWGFSEVYWLRTSDVDTALEHGFDICNRRRLWFGLGTEIVYAELSQGPASLDTWAIDVDRCYAFPSGGVDQPEFPDNPWVSWMYSHESLNGRFGTRHFRCVPDNWVRGMRAIRPGGILAPLHTHTLPPIVLQPGAYNPGIIIGADSLEALQRSFLDSLLKYTGYLTRNKSGTGPAWSIEPLDRYAFAAVRKKNINGPWKRYSCEGGWVWRCGQWTGPSFDFCGMCVGVGEKGYSAPCHWYANEPPFPPRPWPVTGIRFYRVSRWAPVFYGQLRFGPKWSEPDYHNTSRAGEVTTRGRRSPYTAWNSLASRDGTHPDITARQAAGEEPWPGL